MNENHYKTQVRLNFKSCHYKQSMYVIFGPWMKIQPWIVHTAKGKAQAHQQGRYNPEVNRAGVNTYGNTVPELSMFIILHSALSEIVSLVDWGHQQCFSYLFIFSALLGDQPLPAGSLC